SVSPDLQRILQNLRPGDGLRAQDLSTRSPVHRQSESRTQIDTAGGRQSTSHYTLWTSWGASRGPVAPSDCGGILAGSERLTASVRASIEQIASLRRRIRINPRLASWFSTLEVVSRVEAIKWANSF